VSILHSLTGFSNGAYAWALVGMLHKVMLSGHVSGLNEGEKRPRVCAIRKGGVGGKSATLSCELRSGRTWYGSAPPALDMTIP
jgi:hypothetical protein